MKRMLLLCVLLLIATSAWAQLSGTYYIGAAGTKPDSTNPEYATLKAACDTLNKSGVSGNVTFLITSNLTEPANVGLGLDPGTFTITFKPYTGTTDTITFTQTADNVGASGCWVLGVPNLTVTSASNYGLVTTRNIVIDGSNTVGGTTQNLVLQNTSGDNINEVVLKLLGEVNNVVIKHCIINQAIVSTSSSSNYAVALVNRYNSANTTYYTPDSITVNHCQITCVGSPAAQALAVTNSGTISGTAWPGANNLVFSNNTLVARSRGIFLNYSGSVDIFGNSISVNQSSSGYLSYGIMPNQIATSTASTINVYNNQILQLATANTAAGSYGIIGIYVGVAGTWNVYNNIVSGFSSTASTADPSLGRVWGIQVAGVTANVAFNTVRLPALTYTTSTNATKQLYVGVYITSGTLSLKNNIVVSEQTADSSFGIYNAGGTLTSDFNNVVLTDTTYGFFGAKGSSVLKTLATWRDSTSVDSNSVQIDPRTWWNATMRWTAKPSNSLGGTPINGITADIDGHLRSLLHPTMGAAESPIALSAELNGTYYVGNAGTRPGGGDPDFLSLKAACDSMTLVGVTGDCTFYITSDLTEPKNIGLAVDPGTYTITFKPYTATTPTVKFTHAADDNSGPSGAWLFGIKSTIAWADLATTKNIVIDGSNTPGGTTRDLTIQNDTATYRNAMPIVIVGPVSNMTIKNCNVLYVEKTVSTSGNLFVAPIQIRSRLQTVDYAPSNLTIANNYLSSDYPGVVQSAAGLEFYYNGGTMTHYATNVSIHDNVIKGKRYGIGLYGAQNVDIYKNKISTNEDINTALTSDGILASDLLAGSVVNIYGNEFTQISTMNAAASNGVVGIDLQSKGTYNIYNNMLYGFALTTTTASPAGYLYGIRSMSAADTTHIYFNSINMTNTTATGTPTVSYAGIYVSDGVNLLENNLVVAAEDSFPSYAIYRAGTAGSLTSNHNDFAYVSATNGNVGYFNTAATKDLADWKTASSQDAQSAQVDPTPWWVSATDLRWTAKPSDKLAGIPVAGTTTDIDNTTRSTLYPTMGAVESPVALAVAPGQAIPRQMSLDQNYPNPFNPSTTIRFTVKETGHTTVKVFDMTGREVKTLFDGVAEVGKQYDVRFNGAGMASGVYFYMLRSGGERMVKRMVMVK